MDAQIHDDNLNHGGRFLMGFVAGAAVGTGLALYVFAPRLISAVRQRVADSTTDLRTAASKSAQGVANRAADVLDTIADAAHDVTAKGRAVRDQVADIVAHGAHEVGRGASAVEQAGTASKTDPKPAQS